MSQAPLVSVAIPLFRSAPFVDNISANLEGIPADVEILISDRHGFDDAIDQLERRHAADPRVRFLRRFDRKDWVHHLNDLLREARGDYWRFLPHDDFVDRGALDALVRCLDEHPDTLLAYGPTTATDLEGRRLPERDHVAPHPIGNDDPWILGLALDTFSRGHFNGAFKGLIRRQEILAHRLWIRRPLGAIHAERLWLAALAMVGRFRFVPESGYLKRFHDRSTHARWRQGFASELSVRHVLLSYLRDLVAERRLHRAARHYVNWTTLMRLGLFERPDPLPPPDEPYPLKLPAGLGWLEPRRRRLEQEWQQLYRFQPLRSK